MGEIPHGEKNTAGENPHGEYLCSLSVKITAENTANLFSEFIFEFKNTIKQNKLFFFNFFLFAAGFFPHGENTPWAFTSASGLLLSLD